MKEKITERLRQADNIETINQIYLEATNLKNKGEISNKDFIHIERVKDNRMGKLAERGESGELLK